MPFQEDFAEFLDVEQGFAVMATMIPGFGKPYKIKGIFSNDYYEADIGYAGVGSSKLVFECAGKDLGDVEYGDLINVNKTNYRITEIKPDSYGWIVLLLEKQD